LIGDRKGFIHKILVTMENVIKERGSYHKLMRKLANAHQTEALAGLLKDLNTVEIANSLLQLKLKHQLKVIGLLDRDKGSEVMSHLHDYVPPILQEIVGQMNSVQLGDLIEEMDKDDAADLVSILDDEKASRVLDELPEKDREKITSLLQYDSESAGGIMDPLVVSVNSEITVNQAVRSIQRFVKENEIDEFFVTYVVDEHGHLVGSISLTKLFLAKSGELIKDIMDPDVIAVDVDVDQEKVALLAKEYDLVTVPVIDKHLRLIGRVTSDDMMDVLSEEYEEDIGQIAGTGHEDVLEKSLLKASRDRLPWLVLGLAGGALAAWVMRGFESSLAALPQIAYFIPVVAALGGNIAIQSSSLVVRGLATGQIRTGDMLGRTWKEIRVGLLNGLICSILLFGLTWLLTDQIIMGITTAGALLVVVCLAAFVGTTAPMILKRMHMDPAIATGPFITTANDILGIVIYLVISISVYSQVLL
jgi:magnesium transporter